MSYNEPDHFTINLTPLFLDPNSPSAPEFSEKWMISINV